MPNFYRKGDPTSSPFDPAMGDIVIYRDIKRAGGQRKFPAIITQALAEDRVNLTVFSDTGVRYVSNVPYNASDSAENTYGWMPEKKARVEQQIAKVS